MNKNLKTEENAIVETQSSGDFFSKQAASLWRERGRLMDPCVCLLVTPEFVLSPSSPISQATPTMGDL